MLLIVFKELFEANEAVCESLVGIFYQLPILVDIRIMCFEFLAPHPHLPETSPTASQMSSGCLNQTNACDLCKLRMIFFGRVPLAEIVQWLLSCLRPGECLMGVGGHLSNNHLIR